MCKWMWDIYKSEFWARDYNQDGLVDEHDDADYVYYRDYNHDG